MTKINNEILYWYQLLMNRACSNPELYSAPYLRIHAVVRIDDRSYVSSSLHRKGTYPNQSALFNHLWSHLLQQCDRVNHVCKRNMEFYVEFYFASTTGRFFKKTRYTIDTARFDLDQDDFLQVRFRTREALQRYRDSHPETFPDTMVIFDQEGNFISPAALVETA